MSDMSDVKQAELDLGFDSGLVPRIEEDQELRNDELFDTLTELLDNNRSLFVPQRATFNEAHATLRRIYALSGAKVEYTVSPSPIAVRDILTGSVLNADSDNSAIPVGTVLNFDPARCRGRAELGKYDPVSAVRLGDGEWNQTGVSNSVDFKTLIDVCGEGTVVYVPV